MLNELIKQTIEDKLAALRSNCALQRWHVRVAFGRRWSGCPRKDPANPSSWDLHWENLQLKAQEERPKDVLKADQDLADFIAECRPIMGADWLGNDHGRLCWEPYTGGRPIGHHYCQKAEGHKGDHGNEVGEWPQGVTDETEWRKLKERQAQQA